MRRNKTASDIKEMTAALTSAKFNVGDLACLSQHVIDVDIAPLGIVIGMIPRRLDEGLVTVLTIDGRIRTWHYTAAVRLA